MTDPEPTDPDDEIRTLEHRGCALAWRVRGAGPPVLWIQGVGVHGDGWAPQVDALAAGHACLTFDNRGMGRSQPIGDELSIPQMADDARALLDAAGWPSAHVVGHSMGGLIALELALAAPARVRSLALLCTFARGRDATRLTGRMLWLGLRTRIGPRRARRRAFLRLVLPPGPRAAGELDAMADRLAPLFGHDLADQPPIVMKQLGAMKRHDVTARLGELAGVPTLVVSGAHDPIARPASARAIAAGIPGARHVEEAGASHGLPIDAADRTNALVGEHLAAAEAAHAVATGAAPPAAAR